MSKEKMSRYDRRTILRTSGITAAALLAGCSGGGDGGSGGGDGGNGGGDGGSGSGDGGSGNGGSSNGDLQTLNVMTSQPATTLDPHMTGAIPDSHIIYHSLENLMFRNAEGELIPMLATDWGREEPGRFRFQLREDVQWHNGNAFTADDVKYSVERIVDDDVGGITSQRKSYVPGVTGAEVIDETTVDIISDSVNPLIIPAFSSFLGVAIMNKEWIESREPEEVALDMNGTGPFVLESFEQGVSATFSSNDDYWGDTPPIATANFSYSGEASTRVNGLLAGEQDLTVNIPPQDVPRVEDNEGTAVKNVPSTRICFAAMRPTVEPFTSKKFRQAMNYAIDVEGVIDDVLSGFGTPTGQPTLPMMFGHDPDIEPYPYDPERAAQLVDESGFAGVELNPPCRLGRYLKGEEWMTAWCNQIDALPNVSCEPNLMDSASFVSRLGATGDQRMDFFIWGYGQPSFDASATIRSNLTGEYRGTFRDEELRDLMDRADSAGDRDEREALLQEANRWCHEEAVWIFMHGQSSIYGQNTDYEWRARSDELLNANDIAPK
ncbi:ABC transporter substrate-binding protein [Halomicroarcula sp. GCM10025324]|uniref:ABC transporter substrate-binding protein n=1 Tax=Haloarcula TaxID=2237 RepID=UPI0023E78F90|nr:ABC transporter substrate-binding protein [Halomicroarcula sp. ZS-22-S1]